MMNDISLFFILYGSGNDGHGLYDERDSSDLEGDEHAVYAKVEISMIHLHCCLWTKYDGNFMIQ